MTIRRLAAILAADVVGFSLVMRTRGDLVSPFEAGRALAAGIPGAKFVALDGKNHILKADEPAFERFFEEVALFLPEKASP